MVSFAGRVVIFSILSLLATEVPRMVYIGYQIDIKFLGGLMLYLIIFGDLCVICVLPRMKLGPLEPLHRLCNRRPIFTHNGQNYVVVHCTGYIKNSPPSGLGLDSTPSSCLVAIARLQVASMPISSEQNSTSRFSVRLAEDGKVKLSNVLFRNFIVVSCLSEISKRTVYCFLDNICGTESSGSVVCAPGTNIRMLLVADCTSRRRTNCARNLHAHYPSN